MLQSSLTAPIDLAHSSPEAAPAERAAPKPAKPMRNIILLVGIAILVFIAFTSVSVVKSVQGSAQLATIKDQYFPLLQRLDANIVRLDKIQDLYVQVVITGDRDSISKAAALGAQADGAFAEIAALYPAHEQSVNQLRSDLSQYQQIANKTSIAFLSQDRDAAAPMAAKMNRALAEVNTRLKALRQAAYDDFTETLAHSQRDSEIRLFMGLGLGVMNLGFMGVLVFFIRNNVRMMAVIAEQNETLEARVAERTAQLSQKTADINAMLQNMSLGVSTVVPGNRIHPEYSNYLRTLFNVEDLAGKDLVTSLFGHSTLGADAKDQVAVALGSILDEDVMMFEFNGHLLTREMRLDLGAGVQKIVQMDWTPIVGERGVVEKVLLITQDVTHLRELEASTAHQKDELEIISKIIKISIGKFDTFVESARGYLSDIRQRLARAGDRDAEAIAALFRAMHTIKGNARMFEFAHITNVAHAAEQTYDRLRKDANEPWDMRQLNAELDLVESAISRYAEVSEDTLGRKGRALDLLTNQGAFVGHEQLGELRSLVTALDSGEEERFNILKRAVDRLGLVNLGRIISSAADSLSSLSKELGKPTPTVELEGCDLAVNTRFAEALKSSLMHILRNSLDHGIEGRAERVSSHKPEQGRVRVTATRAGAGIELRLSDDGRGLALHKLHDRGLSEGIFTAGQKPTRATVADMIFRPGLSTSETLTQVSGRGVGMDAVRTFLKEQGASIKIVLDDPDGLKMDFAPFGFIIDIPEAACKH